MVWWCGIYADVACTFVRVGGEQGVMIAMRKVVKMGSDKLY